MGRSDPVIFQFYRNFVVPKGRTALLGFSNNNWFQGDLYDLSLNNWLINSEWELNKSYDTIISTRCPYFAKDPKDFIRRCHDNLNDDGLLFAEWGLGDHWRFDNYKVGWVKNGEQEHAYGETNFLWSTVWDDDFLNDPNFKLFEDRVRKFGYYNVKEAILEEVPSILDLDYIKKYFETKVHLLSLWEDLPQLYILVSGKKI